MRKSIILITLTMLLIGAQAAVREHQPQQPPPQNPVDSLAALLPQMQGDARLDAIIALADLTEDLPEQKQYLDMYLDEARRQKNIAAEGEALTSLVYYYAMQWDSDTVFTVGEESLRFLRQHGLHEDLMLVQQNVIRRLDVQGRKLAAIRRAEEAYAEAKALQNRMYMARMLFSMGTVYHVTGQNGEALRCLSESLELSQQERQPDTYLYIETCYMLACIAGYLNRFDETLRYTDSLRVEVDRLRKHKPGVNLQLYDFIVEALNATVYARTGQVEQSFRATERAGAFFDPQWDGTVYGAVRDEMYAAYHTAAGDYDRAIAVLQRLERFYGDNRIDSYRLITQRQLADVHYKKGDPNAAAALYQRIIEEKDSLHSESIHAHLNELRTVYELDKAELEAQKRLAAIRRQRTVIAGLTLACLALAVIAALVVWSRRRIAEKNRGLYRLIRKQYRLEEQLDTERSKNIRTETSASEEDNIFVRFNDAMNEQQYYTDSNFTRKEAALIIGVSEKALNDSIKKTTGMNANGYINDLRLAHAYRLLLLRTTEKLTIEAIVQNSGFKSRNTFYSLFREKFNITPGDFAKTANELPDNA